MIEKVGHIRNPLTVIAVFAGLAEVSGTVVLPFLDKGMQQTYVWFLMFFPFVLVMAFFLTLNFNRRALYAPSDFREEQHFVDLASAASPEAREEKLMDEVAQLKRMEERQQNRFVPYPAVPTLPTYVPSVSNNNDESRRSKVSISEALALQLLSHELKRPITPGIKLTGRYPSQAILFDGVVDEGETLRAIEVKYFPNGHFQTSDIKKYFSQVERLHLDIHDQQNKILSLTFVVVTDEDGKGQDRIRNRLLATAGRYTMPIEIKVYGAIDLLESAEKKLRVKN